MTKKIVCLILFFSLLQYSCNRQKKQQSSFDFNPPEVVEAKPYVVPQDKMAAHGITPVKEIKREAVSKPKVINLTSNIYPVAKPKTVAAGAPKICTPGQDGFALPKIVPAIDNPFEAGIPEVTIAKEPQVKDNNPESFSTLKVLQGLKSNSIFPIIQDKVDNLWIACYEGGVSKYDGKSFTNYTAAEGLCRNNIWSMLEDSKGNIWFGSLDGGGLSKFDGKFFTRYKNTQGLSDSNQRSRKELCFALLCRNRLLFIYNGQRKMKGRIQIAAIIFLLPLFHYCIAQNNELEFYLVGNHYLTIS